MRHLIQFLAFKPTHTVLNYKTKRWTKVRVIKIESYEALVESRLPNWLGGVNGLLPPGMTSTLREIKK